MGRRLNFKCDSGWRGGLGTISKKVTSEKRHQSEGAMWVSGCRVFQGGWNSLCKGPEADVCLEWLRNSQEASVAGAE